MSLEVIYNINSSGMESFFEIYEILRLFNQFTEGIYFGNKAMYFEDYLNIIRNGRANITKDNIPNLTKTDLGYVTKPQEPFEELLNSTVLLKLSSYTKETASILRYIIANREGLTNDIVKIDNQLRSCMQQDYRVIKIQRNTLFDTEMKALRLSKDKLIEYGIIAAKIYNNLYGDVLSVSFIDHLACCKVIKSIFDKKSKFTPFPCLNFYDRRKSESIFYEQYNRESQAKQSLSSMIKHNKFTTEDCLFGIDIFSVYQEILNVLEVLDYALTTDNEDWAKSPYQHLKVGEAVIDEWCKVIFQLSDYFRNTLNIPVS